MAFARVISLSDVAQMISNGTVDTMFVPEKQQDKTRVLFHHSKEQTSLGVLAHSFLTCYNLFTGHELTKTQWSSKMPSFSAVSIGSLAMLKGQLSQLGMLKKSGWTFRDWSMSQIYGDFMIFQHQLVR